MAPGRTASAVSATFAEACVLGAGVAVAAFFLGQLLACGLHALQYTRPQMSEIFDKEWASTLLSPHTHVLTLVAAGAGAAAGLLAARLERRRRLALVSVATGSFLLVPPVYCAALVLIEEGRTPGDAVIAGGVLGLVVLAAYAVPMIPPVVGGALLLERWTRQGGARRRIAPRLARVCAGAVIVLAAATQAYLPRRPASRVERLMLQVEGRRCDERRGPRFNLEWRGTLVDSCRQDALHFLGALGPEARASTPLLARLITTLRDVDTGDGYLGHQSAAARAMGAIGDPRAIRPLVRALQLEDGPPGSRVARQAIAEALGRFGPRAREAAGPLARAIQACPDEACRLVVSEAQARIAAAR